MGVSRLENACDSQPSPQSLIVMAVLGTAIHVFLKRKQVVDARYKSGHDETWFGSAISKTA
jgi:hypothetical protein